MTPGSGSMMMSARRLGDRSSVPPNASSSAAPE
jgi:hypothetical protein